ncbi:MFS transporter [Dysgonomonas sp. 520]|uniref:MFS transporter n=1 Tax=Dysgonomonas sp. 520 TaxID=2302931 RepID=UPI0013CFB635|nr:MFS transporter [Dysgonomonas sp. 520]NDW10971.1 MFS transporter [Dysgonomonas sp. 520]
MKQKSIYIGLLPVMLAFFCMGFVDMVGTATNYAQKDLGLDDATANIFPSMVFFWFLIFSVPTGMLMSRIGQRKTVVISLIVTAVSMLIPFLWYDKTSLIITFSLLGIGNTLMQVSINPLLSNIVKGDKLASSLTFGQFIKAIASFSAPLIATRAALMFDDWRMIYPLFLTISIISTIWLSMIHIEEEKQNEKGVGFTQCFKLLGNGFILLSFLGIMCHVGIDVGTNVTAPRILMERLGLTELNDANYATSVYFAFRTAGCFLGAFILARFSAKKFFALSVVLMALGMVGLYFLEGELILCLCIGLIGFGNSNVFSVILSRAMLFMPDKKNEISGLMIMGLFGGTIFPFFMGQATKFLDGSQIGALIVMSIGVFYLLFLSMKIKEERKTMIEN